MLTQHCSFKSRKITAIITAAGLSSRMGQLKAMLPWNGTTLISHQVKILKQVGCTEIIVVVGHRSTEITEELKNEEVIIVNNPNFLEGRASSINIGITRSDLDAQCFILLGVDQPRNEFIISKLIDSHFKNRKLITSPRNNGKGGHPVLFSSELRTELMSVEENDIGLRSIFDKYRNNSLNKVDFFEDLVCLDLNTTQDYEFNYKKYN